MKRLWSIAIVIVACASCAGDDTGSSATVDALVSDVASVREAAATGDPASFTAATAELRATVAAMHNDAELSDEKAAAILVRLQTVETEFGRTLPTTTTVAPTTVAPTTTPAPGPTPKGKGKKSERDKDD